jgi:hypothetical protein
MVTNLSNGDRLTLLYLQSVRRLNKTVIRSEGVYKSYEFLGN